MKPYYVVLLMGVAALGGGLVVRYSDHPVEITMAHSAPPAVVAPPIPPTARVGPSTSVPVRSAPRPVAAVPVPEPEKPVKTEKPSVFSIPARAPKSERSSPEPPIVARVRIAPEPPAVIPLERTTVAPPPPNPAPVAAAPVTPPAKPAQVAPPEPNRATLKEGLLITVRVNEALSSNLNAPGDVFSGRLERPLVADGFVIAERGAHVRGEVVESKSGGPSPELSVRLREVQASDGQRVHLVSAPWKKVGAISMASPPISGNVYDAALTRGGAAVIRPATTITFRLDQSVDLTEKH